MIKKIFVSTTALTLAVSTVAYAASPTVFPHGISASASIVNGAGVSQGTVGEAATAAAGAVQANGGDTTKTVVTAGTKDTITPTPVTGSSVANTDYIHNYSPNAIGANNKIDQATLQSMVDKSSMPMTMHAATGEYLDVAKGTYLNIAPGKQNNYYMKFDGQPLTNEDMFNDYIGSPGWNVGHLANRVGDGVLVESFVPAWGIERDRQYSDNSVYDTVNLKWPAPITSDNYVVNADINIPSNCTRWCSWLNYQALVHVTNATNHSKAGIDLYHNYLEDFGLGYGGGYGIGTFSQVHAAGTNWDWVKVNELDEVGSYNAAGFTKADGTQDSPGVQRYLTEWDYSGIGPEDPRTSYDPLTYGQRKIMWYNQFQNQLNNWGANVTNKKDDLIGVTNPADNVIYMYTATVDKGVTGSTQPKFAFNEANGSFVKDGTQEWAFLGAKRFEVGCGLCFYPPESQDMRIGTLLAAKAKIIDSPIDMAQASYVAAIHAVMRSSANSYFDLSADGTAAGQNNHLVGYGDLEGQGFSKYEVLADPNGKSSPSRVWGVTDTGIPLTTQVDVNAAGTDLGSATPIASEFTFVKGGNGANGVSINASDAGMNMTIYNIDSGGAIWVYPQNVWRQFIGMTAGSPKLLLPGQTMTVKMTDFGYYVPNISGTVRMSKSSILALTSGVNEGQKIYDTDDHEEVTYRCPTASTCGWFPVQYGMALSK